ncbi:hypothetical protein AQJ64_30970 [Streptomyces griseoruber]|uniref:Lipoprotein n=1 Tax=Streptomyces griseoruber TaxID=1943 RepID=A0A101SQJ4_9ACTN|nr:hypothetical protein AQJ64_30970 [Streptomyces griseoruber]
MRLRGGAATAAMLMSAVTVAAVAGCAGQGTGDGLGSGSGSGSGPKAGGGAALAAAGELTVKGRAPQTGYERDRFGTAWADTDSNGCDTRVISMVRAVVRLFSQRMQGVVGCA